MPGGRPSEYDPAYCARVIELGRSGASVVEMAHEIGCSRATIEANWPAAHPEFLEAMEAARLASQVWWERIGQKNLEKPTFQSSVWSRSMAARFPKDWREKSLVGSDPENPLPAGFQVNLVKPVDGADAG